MSVVTSIWEKKYCFNKFKVPIVTLLLIEIVLIVLWAASPNPMFRAVKGHLVKNGQQYIVFWINDERQQAMVTMDNLDSAMGFIRNELNLEFATHGLEHPPLEVVWLKHNLHSFSLFWKTADSGYLNRLTFVSRQEAEVFKDLFSQGAYSRSPIGHSLALKPTKKN